MCVFSPGTGNWPGQNARGPRQAPLLQPLPEGTLKVPPGRCRSSRLKRGHQTCCLLLRSSISSLSAFHLNKATDADRDVPVRMLISKGPYTSPYVWWVGGCVCSLPAAFVHPLLCLFCYLGIHYIFTILQQENPLNVSEAGSCLT